MSETMKCPRCEGEMTEGFILDADHTGAPMAPATWFTQAKWVAGKPESSVWTGVKWSDKEAFRISAWRCVGCGLVELHALEPTNYREVP